MPIKYVTNSFLYDDIAVHTVELEVKNMTFDHLGKRLHL